MAKGSGATRVEQLLYLGEVGQTQAVSEPISPFLAMRRRQRDIRRAVRSAEFAHVIAFPVERARLPNRAGHQQSRTVPIIDLVSIRVARC